MHANYMQRAEAEVQRLTSALLAAQHRIRHDDGFVGIGFRLRRWYASAMAKPWNPKDAPMSLRESENLLRADADDRHSKDEWKFLWEAFKLLGAVLLVVFAVAGIGYGVYINLGLIFR